MYNTYVIETLARQQMDERVANAERARRGRRSRRTWKADGRTPVPAHRAFARVAAIRVVLPH